jgi:hypothetical protein
MVEGMAGIPGAADLVERHLPKLGDPALREALAAVIVRARQRGWQRAAEGGRFDPVVLGGGTYDATLELPKGEKGRYVTVVYTRRSDGEVFRLGVPGDIRLDDVTHHELGAWLAYKLEHPDVDEITRPISEENARKADQRARALLEEAEALRSRIEQGKAAKETATVIRGLRQQLALCEVEIVQASGEASWWRSEAQRLEGHP